MSNTPVPARRYLPASKLHRSEPVKYSGAPERASKTVAIKTQSAVVARATASICNAERRRFGRSSGCGGMLHRLSARRAVALAVIGLASACGTPVHGHGPLPPEPPEHGAGPGTAIAPLPDGWPGPRPRVRPVQGGDAPLWGLPAYQPPSAAHCRGPQRLHEVPGQAQAPQERDAAGGPREGRVALSLSKSAPPAAPSAAAAEAPAAADSVRSRSEAARDMAAEPRRALGAAAGSTTAMAPMPAPPPQRQAPAEPVTAGMVDDNADFGEYLNFRQRWAHLGTRDRDVSERYRIEVRDPTGQPAADAEVALSWPGAARAIRFARTDAAGTLWLHPRALVAPWELAGLQRLEVQVRHGDDIARAPLQRGQKQAVQLRLDSSPARPARQPLDVVFLVDATGSMADEIAKLRDSIRSIADRVQALPQRPQMCWGLVAYRDRSDAFLTRTHDLTDDLGAFHGHLTRLQAGGGGDYPEALNEALHQTVHRISWRGDGTARLVVLVADAPPHLDYGQPYYDQDSAAALARGIKIHTVGASGLNRQGEAVHRQMAQTTGGKFVFLTYQDARRPGAAPGTQTNHDVRNYSVDTLDELIVRLVTDELSAGGRR